MVILRLFFLFLGLLCGALIVKHEKKTEQKPASRSDLLLFVRHDLKMGKGKIGAQCAHAVLKTLRSGSKGWTGLIRVFRVDDEA